MTSGTELEARREDLSIRSPGRDDWLPQSSAPRQTLLRYKTLDGCAFCHLIVKPPIDAMSRVVILVFCLLAACSAVQSLGYDSYYPNDAKPPADYYEPHHGEGYQPEYPRYQPEYPDKYQESY